MDALMHPWRIGNRVPFTYITRFINLTTGVNMRIRNTFFAAVLAIATLFARLASAQQMTLSVGPAGAVINAQTQEQFYVSEDAAENPNGTWSTTPGCGTIDQSGIYTAPDAHSVPWTNLSCPITFTNALNGQSVAVNVQVIATYDHTAQLPVHKVDSSMANTPAPGAKTLVVAGQLQTAITNAKCGDTLLLQPTVVYSGAFKLPNKGCDDGHWVVIRTSALDSALPAEGTRISPCYAGVASLPGRPALNCASTQKVMATIITPNGATPITLLANAGHYRLGPGLEVTRTAANGLVNVLITGTGGATGPADHLIIDRDWIHGTAQDETTRGVMLSGITYAGVVDSYINDFHCATNGACADSQAIAGGTGPLPSGIFKIENNFLEAASENILFGGVVKNSATPQDVVIRRNHMYKPLIWMPGYPGFVGKIASATVTCPKFVPTGTVGQCPFSVKNLLEMKNVDRLLVEDNVMDFSWPGFSQHGNSFLLSGLNPAALTGASVYSTVSISNVTFRLNYVRHTTSGMNVINMAGNGSGAIWQNLPVFNVAVHDDIFDDINPKYLGPDSPNYDDLNMFGISSCANGCSPLAGVVIDHVTMLGTAPRGAFTLGGPGTQQEGFTFTNSILSTPAGVVVTGGGSIGCAFTGTTNLSRITACLTSAANFNGNVLIGGTKTWPIGNATPATPDLVGFTNYNNAAGGDYSLLPTSPYKNKGLDGKDPGADTAAVLNAVAGVE